MQLRVRIGMTLLAIAVAAGLAFGFLPRAVSVDTVAATTGPLAVTVEEEGKTRVKERYVISAPMSGYARRITLHVGDEVKAGQVLAEIEPARADALDPRAQAQAAARVKAADAALAAAREKAREATAQATLADKELERMTSLQKSNFISAQALDKARTELTRSQAAQSAAEHNTSVARAELDMARAAFANVTRQQSGNQGERLQVRAPVQTRVLKIIHESEGAVRAGEPLIEIGNPESLETEIEVISTQAVKITPETKVLLDRWGGETTLQGAVRVIEPAGFTKVSALGVEEQRVRVIVDFTSPREAWQRLGDGYRVEARFVVWEGAEVLQIPASALFRHNGGWAVFVTENGRARLRVLQTGQRNGLQVQVLSGLKAGEVVIARPDDKVSDGVRVKPR